jgi:hypothetical protein
MHSLKLLRIPPRKDERMTPEQNYNINMTINSPWRVSYQYELDEIFLFRIDSDDLVSVFRNGRLDAMFFAEFLADAPFI